MRTFLKALALLGVSGAATAAPVTYGSLTLNLSGKELAAVEKPPAAGNSPAGEVIVVRAVSDGHVLRRLTTCASCRYTALAWGRDDALAFLAREPGKNETTLNVAQADGVRTIATIPGIASTLRFSPKGDRIAALVTLNAAKETGATQAGARLIGEIGSHDDQQRIAVFPLSPSSAGSSSSQVSPISPEGRFIYEYVWTPDGRGFVATSAAGNGDENWWVATLDAIDAATGARREIVAPTLQMRFPKISPDGSTVAFVGGLDSDYDDTGGDLWTVPYAGGVPTNRTQGMHYTVRALDWTKGGLQTITIAGGDTSIGAFDLTGGNKVAWTRQAGLAASDDYVTYSADGKIAATVLQDFEHAPAIYAGPIHALNKVTHDNDGIAPLVKARSVTWTNEGFTMQGWLLMPRGETSGKLPMIVNVHGGPANLWMPNFITEKGITAALTHAGYAVFLPNPRGSQGQGQTFTVANRRDFGGGDLRDILSGIDAVEKVAPIDDTRLGMLGNSYGGFMTMWTNTQTHRFKALVAGAGVADWVSLYGNNGINKWMIPYFGKSVYEDPEAYERISPILHITKAATPTFIFVGERDIEVPSSQSMEYWYALKEMGVPTKLVIYPDEGHSLRGPDHVADLIGRVVGWFNQYLGAGQ